MDKERLQHLVKVLEEVAKQSEQRFDLSSWFKPDETWSDKEEAWVKSHYVFYDIPKSKTLSIPHACGAIACACGYAGLYPQFRAEGFITFPDGKLQFVTENRIYKGWDAVEKFFDIGEEESRYLFDSSAYKKDDRKNIHAVIDRLCTFVVNAATPLPWWAENGEYDE